MKLKSMTLEEFISRCFPGETYPQRGVVINHYELDQLFEYLNEMTSIMENIQYATWKCSTLRQDLANLKSKIVSDSTGNSL